MKKKRILCRMKPRDIKNSRRKSACFCPIANCISRTLKIDNPYLVVVTKEKISRYDPKDQLIYFKPSIRMQRFIEKFDNGDSVKPINFYLEEVSR